MFFYWDCVRIVVTYSAAVDSWSMFARWIRGIEKELRLFVGAGHLAISRCQLEEGTEIFRCQERIL